MWMVIMTHSLTAPELNLLLLGETLSGKTSAGNVILGRHGFNAGKHTTRSSKRIGSFAERTVVVVDTPGWCVGIDTPGSVTKELRRSLSLCSPGPHAILLVVSAAGAFCQRKWRAMEQQLSLIQAPVWQRALLLLTHGAEIPARTTTEGHIREKGKSLLWLLERCENRFHAVDSQAKDNHIQIQLLLEKIDRMVEANRRPRERLYILVRESLTLVGGMEQGTKARGNQQSTAAVPREASKQRPAALNIVLLGRRYSGKSSAGNFILGRREFDSGRKTLRCTLGHVWVRGGTVTVVDTPGWSVYGLANPKQVRAEMAASATLCPNGGVRVFLLAIPLDSFSNKDMRAVEKYMSVLGELVWRTTTVLFTYADELRGTTIEEHIGKREHLQGLLGRCGHRYHVLHNSISGDRNEVLELLEIVMQK